MNLVKKFFQLSLWKQVVIGMLLGIATGLILGEDAVMVKPFGTVFINLIKMVVVPLIFFALISGITSMGEGQNFTRVGVKGIFAYLSTAAFAVVIGLVAGNIFQPGVGVTLDLTGHAPSPHPLPQASAPPSVSELLLGLIPTNAFRAMVDDHFLQVIVFAIFTGITLNVMGESSKQVKSFAQECAKVTFKMIETIVKLAPFGVFGFISWVVGTQGLEVIKSLIMLVVTVLSACLFQYLLFGVIIAVFGRISPLPFYRKILEAQALAFATSSSKATLTTAMRVLQERMGVSKTNTNFLMPLGACINMDGTAIYLGICALFFAQAAGVTLSMYDYGMLLLTCTLGSIGAAGIPSGSIIFMGMVLGSIGLPLEGIGIILGVDRILDMVRTTINITGDSAITLIVDSSEKTLDKDRYYAPDVEIIIVDESAPKPAATPHVVINNAPSESQPEIQHQPVRQSV